MVESLRDRIENDQSLKLEIYKIAVQTRNLEINLFWQRSNYLLVLSLGIAAGYCSLRGSDRLFALLLAVMGIAVAGLWLAINLGGKYWQAKWEYRAKLAELDLAPHIRLFSTNRDTNDNDVAQSFDPNVGYLRKLHRVMILCRPKPTVSEVVTLLSALFVGFWSIVTVIAAIQLLQKAPQAHKLKDLPKVESPEICF